MAWNIKSLRERGALFWIEWGFLLLVFGVGTFSAFMNQAPVRYWLAIGSIFFVLIFIWSFIPKASQGRFWSTWISGYIACVGVLYLLAETLFLWKAATEGIASIPNRANLSVWASLRDDPWWFWFSVACDVLLIYVISSNLKNFVVSRFTSKPKD